MTVRANAWTDRKSGDRYRGDIFSKPWPREELLLAQCPAFGTLLSSTTAGASSPKRGGDLTFCQSGGPRNY